MDNKELLEIWCAFGIESEYDIIEIIPEMKEMIGLEVKNSNLHLFHHAIYTFLSINSDKIHLKLAALLHDIGKVKMKKIQKDGSIDYNGHHKLSVKMTREILNKMNFDKEIIDKTLFLIDSHEKDWTTLRKKQIKKFHNLLLKNDITFEEYYNFLIANLASKNFDYVIEKIENYNLLLEEYYTINNLTRKEININDINFSESDIENDPVLKKLKINKFLLKEVCNFATRYNINNKFIFYSYLYKEFL